MMSWRTMSLRTHFSSKSRFHLEKDSVGFEEVQDPTFEIRNKAVLTGTEIHG